MEINPNTKRIIAREFLVLVVVAVIALSTVGIGWGRNVIIEKQLDQLENDVKARADSVSVIDARISSPDPIPEPKNGEGGRVKPGTIVENPFAQFEPPKPSDKAAESHAWKPPADAWIVIEAPDGTTLKFPSSMSMDEIKAVMRKKFPPSGSTQSNTPSTSASTNAQFLAKSNADLGKEVKAKYPGAYDNLSDDELGRKVNRKFLYEALTKDGYAFGTLHEFSSKLDNPEKVKALYDGIIKDGYQVGDFRAFNEKMGVSESMMAMVQKREALFAEKSQIDKRIEEKRKQVSNWEERWNFAQLSALILLAVAYPLRFLLVGIRWSIKTLRAA